VAERLRGRIRWFSHQKRYGRIQRRPGLPDIFVQIGDFQDAESVHESEDGGFAEFSVEQTLAGPIASNIVLLPSER
jgi:cold shock CspA family protein